MKRKLLFTSLLALGLGAAAQTAPVLSAALPAANMDTPPVTSNGPVTLDVKNLPPASADPTEAKIALQVRHQLLTLLHYGVFDDIEYSVQGRTVTLSGAVTSQHSQTRQDAERGVKKIEGVDKVVNNIRVLPVNLLDDQARERTLSALSRTGGLSQYFYPASPDIRIIVDNLHLTLKGYVNNEGDKNMANVAANQVRDLFQVTNSLVVTK
jgi:hyperosmotically inducible periplasmic protein